jgi:hypothetical protein
MNNLREKFLKIYANIPINLRDEIILVLDDKGSISWNVAYIEIKANSEISRKILEELNELKLI